MRETNGIQPEKPADHTTQADIAELIEITRGEGEAIRRLNGCVEQLCRVHAAKEALLQVDPAQLRAALLRHLPAGLLQQKGSL